MGVAAGPDGEVYTVEMIDGRIWKLLPGGKSVELDRGGFRGYPDRIAARAWPRSHPLPD